jgi:hypothetical protein
LLYCIVITTACINDRAGHAYGGGTNSKRPPKASSPIISSGNPSNAAIPAPCRPTTRIDDDITIAVNVNRSITINIDRAIAVDVHISLVVNAIAGLIAVNIAGLGLGTFDAITGLAIAATVNILPINLATFR